MNELKLSAFLILASVFTGCSTIDLKYPREPSSALADPSSTRLGQLSARAASENGGNSGFHLLSDGMDAFTARMLLIDAAQQTLDVQYYIIHGDSTGKLLVDRMLAAADRGVRVRILVDDIYAVGHDENIALVDLHPNIEVRLFNPWKYRGNSLVRGFEFLRDVGRLNHRMHNKLIAADNSAMIMGGRNLGDEYFGLNEGMGFADLDVLAIGPITAQATQHFDDYWNSQWAVPVQSSRELHAKAKSFQQTREQLSQHRQSMRDSRFGMSAATNDFVQEVRQGRLALIYAPANVVADDPTKVTSDRVKDRSQFLFAQMRRMVPPAKQELLVASPYFVPGEEGVQLFLSLTTNGVVVRVLTNAQEANDVSVVHSGYAPYRADLLRGGVQIYELKRLSETSKSQFKTRQFGSANASLHAKCLLSDREHIFIGSLNLDPRSIQRNTETGLLIESPELGAQVANLLERGMNRTLSYEVVLKNGKDSRSSALEWITIEDGKEVRLKVEPGTTWFQRFKTKLLRLLPIESQI